MTFDLPEAHRAIQRTVREFCEAEVKPHARRWDDEERFPLETVRALGELVRRFSQYASRSRRWPEKHNPVTPV